LSICKFLVKKRLRTEDKNVLFILDGHKSHADSFNALVKVDELKLVTVCLQSHWFCNHSMWLFLKRSRCNWLKTIQHALLSGKRRYDFARLFNDTWLSSSSRSKAIKGFEATGIFPFNRNRIDTEVFSPPEPSKRPVEETLAAAPPIERPVEETFAAAPPIERPVKNIEPELNEGQKKFIKRCSKNVKENAKILKELKVNFSDIINVPIVERTKKTAAKKSTTRVLTSRENMNLQIEKELVTSLNKKKQRVTKEMKKLSKSVKQLATKVAKKDPLNPLIKKTATRSRSTVVGRPTSGKLLHFHF